MTTTITDGPLGPRRYAAVKSVGLLPGLRATGLTLEEPAVPRLFDLTLWLIMMLIVSLTALFLFVPLGQARSLTGKLAEPPAIVAVSAPVAGTVSDLKIKSGDHLIKGQLIAIIKPQASMEERQELYKRTLQAGLEIELLSAIAENRKPDFSKLPKATPQMIDQAMATHDSFIARREAERNEAKRQAEQSIAARDANDDALQGALNQLADLERQLETRMSTAGATHLREQRDIVKAEVIRLNAEQIRIANSIERATQILASLDRRYAEAAVDKVKQGLVVYQDNRKRLAELEKTNSDQMITAPADGIAQVVPSLKQGDTLAVNAAMISITPTSHDADIIIKTPKDIVLSSGMHVLINGADGKIMRLENDTAIAKLDDASKPLTPGAPITIALPGSRQPLGAVLLGLIRRP